MILVDTNVWIQFFRGHPPSQVLASLLTEQRIVLHPWVYGELCLGHLGHKRDAILSSLKLMTQLPEYPVDKLGLFITEERLYQKGLSLVDAHLLYASLVNHCLLWSYDRDLKKAAKKYGIDFESYG